MIRVLLSILFLFSLITSNAQSTDLIKELMSPIPIDLKQSKLIDSISPYLTDFDENHYRFRLKTDTYFKNENEVFLFVIDFNDYYLSPKDLKNNTKVKEIGLEYKLGTIDSKDKKALRDFKNIYQDYCKLFKEYDSMTYELFGDLWNT